VVDPRRSGTSARLGVEHRVGFGIGAVSDVPAILICMPVQVEVPPLLIEWACAHLSLMGT
jgi:hypothetical protein